MCQKAEMSEKYEWNREETTAKEVILFFAIATEMYTGSKGFRKSSISPTFSISDHTKYAAIIERKYTGKAGWEKKSKIYQ